MDKRRMLKSYGHKCTLPIELLDETFNINYPKGQTIFLKIWYGLRKSFLIRDFNMRASKFCRSEYGLYMQRKFHLETAPNIIHPLSPFRKWWEFLMIIISLCVLIFLPFTAAFILLPNLNDIHTYMNYPRKIFDVFCILDLVINFRTGFYDDYRHLILNQKKIVKRYMKTYFICDLLSSMPLVSTGMTYIDLKERRNNILYIASSEFKLLRLFSCLHYINNFAKTMNFRIFETKLFLTILIGIFFFHWTTCLSIIVGVLGARIFFPSPPEQQSWITNEDLWNSSTAALYATALYRTTCIVSLTEYDLIVDNTLEDQILVCITWIIARIFYLLLAAFLVQLTRSLRSSETEYKIMLSQLLQYMQHKQLSAYTQSRLISYYEFRFQKIFYKESEIFDTISGPIKQEMLMLRCLQMVRNVPFFKGLPERVMWRIVKSLQLEIYLTDDIIFHASSVGTCMYFIISGTVAGYIKSGIEVIHLYDGEYFGYVGLTMNRRILTTIAAEPCEIYRLERDDLYKIMQPYPDLIETLENISVKRMHFLTTLESKFSHFQSEKRSFSFKT